MAPHTNTHIIDNDRDEIVILVEGMEIRGWSYASEPECRMKMLAAHEFCEGVYWAETRRDV